MESKMKETKKNDGEISILIAKENDLLRKLEGIRRRNFQLKIEALSWESVAKAKVCELANLERKLNEYYRKIWSSREEFCDGVDCFLESFDMFSQNTEPQTEYDHDSETLLEEKLKESIATEEDLEKSLTKRLNELQEERDTLTVSIDSEKKRLEEWIQITRDRCTELNRRIHEKKTLTDEKHDFQNNKLFSMVNLEEVKKLTHI